MGIVFILSFFSSMHFSDIDIKDDDLSIRVKCDAATSMKCATEERWS